MQFKEVLIRSKHPLWGKLCSDFYPSRISGIACLEGRPETARIFGKHRSPQVKDPYLCVKQRKQQSISFTHRSSLHGCKCLVWVIQLGPSPHPPEKIERGGQKWCRREERLKQKRVLQSPANYLAIKNHSLIEGQGPSVVSLSCPVLVAFLVTTGNYFTGLQKYTPPNNKQEKGSIISRVNLTLGKK